MSHFFEAGINSVKNSLTPGKIAKNPKAALDPYNVFTKPDIAVPDAGVPPPLPSNSDPSIAEEARKERQRAQGRASTIFTGDYGDTSAPTTARRVLLGQ